MYSRHSFVRYSFVSLTYVTHFVTFDSINKGSASLGPVTLTLKIQVMCECSYDFFYFYCFTFKCIFYYIKTTVNFYFKQKRNSRHSTWSCTNKTKLFRPYLCLKLHELFEQGLFYSH